MNERSFSVNGISIYSLTNPNLRSFCLSLYVRAGSIFEDSSNNGISHIFEHVVFRNLKDKYENFYELIATHGLSISMMHILMNLRHVAKRLSSMLVC